jgi:predicted MFS family arabinose efflux permease
LGLAFILARYLPSLFENTMNATSHTTSTMTRGMVMLFAFCCGAIVANIYYAQPIIELIAPDIGLTPAMASLIVSLTQIGYALGLFFLVPLGDLLENRKLMIATTVVAIASLLGAAFTEQPNLFLLVSLLIGFSSVSVQILIPLAAHLAPEESRGRVVGSIMGGLLLGILLARPVSSVVADHFGWRAMFMAAAALMAFISIVLMLTIPKRQPDHSASYGQLLRSWAPCCVNNRCCASVPFTRVACSPPSACSGPPPHWSWYATMA